MQEPNNESAGRQMSETHAALTIVAADLALSERLYQLCKGHACTEQSTSQLKIFMVGVWADLVHGGDSSIEGGLVLHCITPVGASRELTPCRNDG